jgi:hypothetical protein
MIVTQREKRYPISAVTVSGVRDDGVTCVDDASQEKCAVPGIFLRLNNTK